MQSKIFHITSIFNLMVFILGITGCEKHNETIYGYIEARFIYVSSPTSGQLEKLDVSRGDKVHVGQQLYQLELEPDHSIYESAKAALLEAKATLANLSTGQRPSELAAIEADIEGAIANHDFANKQLSRVKRLISKASIEEDELDKANKEVLLSGSYLKQLKAKLATANLPAREQEIEQAKAHIEKANSELTKTQWFLQKKSISSKYNATVFDIFYEVGEDVPPYQPVLSLLVDDLLRAVFFVPEEQLSQIKYGHPILITCDNCKNPVPAQVSFISSYAEYTPPIIYSRYSRAKLVYRVEATLDNKDQNKLHPGQPIDIDLNVKNVSYDNKSK